MYLREAQLKLHPPVSMSTAVNVKPQEKKLPPSKREEVHHPGDLEFVEREIQINKQRAAVEDKKVERGAGSLSQDADENELITKAKIQVERLINSFNALIKSEREKHTQISYAQIEFERKHVDFNKSIKAYVDVCCNSPGLVSLT